MWPIRYLHHTQYNYEWKFHSCVGVQFGFRGSGIKSCFLNEKKNSLSVVLFKYYLCYCERNKIFIFQDKGVKFYLQWKPFSWVCTCAHHLCSVLPKNKWSRTFLRTCNCLRSDIDPWYDHACVCCLSVKAAISQIRVSIRDTNTSFSPMHT